MPADLFAEMVRAFAVATNESPDALTAEELASQIWGMWFRPRLDDGRDEDVFGGGLIDHCFADGSPDALGLLTALSAVAPQPFRGKAAMSAGRLRDRGLAQPRWTPALDSWRATEAWKWWDPVDDDGVSILVGFEGEGPQHSMFVYVDHNLGGIAKDAHTMRDTPGRAIDILRKHGEPGIEYAEIDLSEAEQRWRDGLTATLAAFDPAVTDEFPRELALARRRLEVLPRAEVPSSRVEIDDNEREGIVTDFLASRWGGQLVDAGADADDVADLVWELLTFSFDVVHGTPLRCSPVMIELFCCDWAPRTVVGLEDDFELLADVLRCWIEFAAGRRGISDRAVRAGLAACDRYIPEMAMRSGDPRLWSQEKTTLMAMMADARD